MSKKAIETTPDDSMDFDLAFDESLTPSVTNEKDPEGVEEKEPEVAEEESAEPEGKEQEPEVAEQEETKAEPEPEPVVEQPKPDQTLLNKIAALEHQLVEASKPKPEPVKEPEPEKDPLEASDKDALKAMAEDWPDLTRGLNAQLKLERAAIEKMVKETVQGVLTQLQPALKTVETVAQNSFLDELTRLHPDAEKIHPLVDKWVGTLTASVSKAYKEVLDFGNAKEVSDVFDLYKKLHGVVPPALKTQVQPDPEKKNKLTQMSSVRRERTGVSAEVDKDDFVAAFERAVQS